MRGAERAAPFVEKVGSICNAAAGVARFAKGDLFVKPADVSEVGSPLLGLRFGVHVFCSLPGQ